MEPRQGATARGRLGAGCAYGKPCRWRGTRHPSEPRDDAPGRPGTYSVLPTTAQPIH